MGSIPQLSSIFINMEHKIILFVHGFLIYEAVDALKSPSISLRGKMGSIYSISLWNVSTVSKSIDIYICHSITACEANNIRGKFIILPQFIFPEEIETYNRLQKSLAKINKEDAEVRIVMYTSYALSPRLLKPNYAIKLMKGVSNKVANKRISLIIIDPMISNEYQEVYDRFKLIFIKPLSRRKFLQLLALADIYLERCVDEELSISSIEAALLETPIAKLTHPRYVVRQDYKDEILWASSPQNFIDKLSDYIQHIDYWRPYYAKRLRDFLITRRNWDYVKFPLLKSVLDTP